MEAQFDRARLEDRDEVIDLANYVFSYDHVSHDFLAMVPKLYRSEYFMDSIHYLARENGKIRAVIGAFPLKMEFVGSNVTLPGRGIGTVCVHPYSRSRGYMKVLMAMALEDMKKDGMVFSCLGGQRQRYEYFNFFRAGSSYTFRCNEVNINHTLGREWTSGLSIKKVNPEDNALLDKIQSLHEAKSMRCERSRTKLFDILSSWKSEIYAVSEGGRFEGYFVYKGGISASGQSVSEIILNDYSRLPEIVGLLMRRQKESGITGAVSISAGPQEKEKIISLLGFAEDYSQSYAYQYAVFDFARFADALVKLKAGLEKIPEGSFVLHVEDKARGFDSRFRLFCGRDGAGAEETNAAPDLKVNYPQAIALLCSPLAPFTIPAAKENDFLQRILPLPLSIENADDI